MSGPKPTRIELTKRQRRDLESIAKKPSSTQASVTRARIILMAAEGHSNQYIADRLANHRQTVRKWRNRWAGLNTSLKAAEAAMNAKELNTYILECLRDQPRCGAPSKFSAEQLCQLIALACEPPEAYERPVTHWTPTELADEAAKQGLVTSISPRHAGRFLKVMPL